MWPSANITVDIDEAEVPVVVITVITPIGRLDIAGNIALMGRTLAITQAHIQGLEPGALGRKGLNAIGRKLLEIADVDEIEIQGATRTTGANKGRPPRLVRFPSRGRAP